MDVVLLEAAINDLKNNPERMRKKERRRQLANLTKDFEQRTWKLTSRTAFYNNMVALNSDGIWDHQQKWFCERDMKEKEKQAATKQAF
jgi:serine/threonine protein phosphatase PrpC